MFSAIAMHDGWAGRAAHGWLALCVVLGLSSGGPGEPVAAEPDRYWAAIASGMSVELDRDERWVFFSEKRYPIRYRKAPREAVDAGEGLEGAEDVLSMPWWLGPENDPESFQTSPILRAQREALFGEPPGRELRLTPAGVRRFVELRVSTWPDDLTGLSEEEQQQRFDAASNQRWPRATPTALDRATRWQAWRRARPWLSVLELLHFAAIGFVGFVLLGRPPTTTLRAEVLGWMGWMALVLVPWWLGTTGGTGAGELPRRPYALVSVPHATLTWLELVPPVVPIGGPDYDGPLRAWRHPDVQPPLALLSRTISLLALAAAFGLSLHLAKQALAVRVRQRRGPSRSATARAASGRGR